MPVEPESNEPMHPLADPRARDYDLALATYSSQLASADEWYAEMLIELGRPLDAAAPTQSARALREKAARLRARWR